MTSYNITEEIIKISGGARHHNACSVLVVTRNCCFHFYSTLKFWEETLDLKPAKYMHCFKSYTQTQSLLKIILTAFVFFVKFWSWVMSIIKLSSITSYQKEPINTENIVSFHL